MTRFWLATFGLASVTAAAGFASCSPYHDLGTGGGAPKQKGDPGALIAVSMKSTVGVLLDEIPLSIRDRVAASVAANGDGFWQERAARQIDLTGYRLVFRALYYSPKSKRQALPIPLEEKWDIHVDTVPTRQTINGHDLVTVDYTLTTTILTGADMPKDAEPALADVGGKWSEKFIFPIDPELVLQRTGFACMDESEFPPNSVDSEEVDSFYDQTCDVEAKETKEGCHFSALPQMSCVDTLDAKVGKVSTTLDYERIPWDDGKADAARLGEITSTKGADLSPVTSEFEVNRVTYRYITPDSCTLVEKCVGGTGWRRLLQFATADSNTGNSTLKIGTVDYFKDAPDGTPLARHGVYEWSACHEHFHFMHYGSFTYGGSAGDGTTKRGFCLQSTKRTSNNELSPLANVYYDCGYQGIEVGWADEYKAGLECQWIDVTDVDLSAGAVTKPLEFHSNPDGFLCEGKPILDSNGEQKWLPTDFTTEEGQKVDKPACKYSPDYDKNNIESYDVTLPVAGEGYVTAPCTRGQIGVLRNCGFTKAQAGKACTPGAAAQLSCTIASGAAPQVVRVCEQSAKLGTAIPCIQSESLAVATVEDSAPTLVDFTCPAARDADEPGGQYSLYTGAAYPIDGAAAVTCTLQ